ncbi:MAG: hypothetical protein R2711_01105 [Acidimicrobiales bacterium]
MAVPIVVALVGFVGDRWTLTGDWASLDVRIAEVGTRDTPLIGAYSTRGWAHPGPSIYRLAAPARWASGGDPRSMMWTAGAINLASIGAIAWVARRRGGDAMALVALLACALLAHGLGPGRVIDLWNPIVPLFPLLLVAFLAWSAATGERRHAVPALLVGALVAQAHVSMVALLAVIGAWAVAWTVLERRGHPPDDEVDGDVEAEGADDRRPGWVPVLAAGGGLAALAFVPPLVDQVARTGNLGTLARYFVAGGNQPVGLGTGLGLVSRYVRPDGPWLGGPEPTHGVSVLGSGALPTLAILVALAAMAIALWRRGWRTDAAGASLALVLVAAAVPIASRVDRPIFDYLVKWLEVPSAFAWFWLAWGTWRLLVRPATVARGLPRPALAGVGVVAIALVAAWSVPAATRLHFPAAQREAKAVAALVPELAATLPHDRPVRIEHRGDDFGNVASGIIVGLRRSGVDVVTTDGWTGLKYGPDAVWKPGDPAVSPVLTVAVDYPYRLRSTRRRCLDEGARPVAEYDQLTAEQRRWLTDMSAKALFEPELVTPAEQRRADRLGPRAFAVTVFEADDVCATGP